MRPAVPVAMVGGFLVGVGFMAAALDAVGDRSDAPPPATSPDDPNGRVAVRERLRAEHVVREASCRVCGGGSCDIFYCYGGS